MQVHPQKTHFTVAEKGSYPKIIIYEYPSLKPYRILRGKSNSVCKILHVNLQQAELTEDRQVTHLVASAYTVVRAGSLKFVGQLAGYKGLGRML